MEYLTFRLYGPMASWGEIAVGEARHSGHYPSKSAMVGLLGAALGIRREDEDAHLNLTETYQQAIKVLHTGKLLKDYHTAQAPDSAGKFRYRTRRDELITGRDRLGTVLSSREYLTDSQALVTIKASDRSRWTLTQLKNALLKPKFHLYLGRKAFPLAAPLNPQVTDSTDFRSALDSYKVAPLICPPSENTPEWQTVQHWLPVQPIIRYYWEGALSDFSSDSKTFPFDQVLKLSRYDKPASKLRWQFQPRTEYCWLQESPSYQEAN